LQYLSTRTVAHHILISKPSKSAEKREAIALQALGEQLVNLSNKELNSIHLDKRLLQAVVDAKSIRARGALKRQKQLIGKLMRKIDPIPIRAAIDRFNKNGQREKIIFKKTEYWRNRILLGDTTVLEEFFAYVGHDNERLTVMVNSSRNMTNTAEKTKAKRSIFREIYNEIDLKVQKDSSTV
tara:strand:- start:264 stop:809 length:546 start_codon:yes stop_codon:yes gene_type:complete